MTLSKEWLAKCCVHSLLECRGRHTCAWAWVCMLAGLAPPCHMQMLMPETSPVVIRQKIAYGYQA